MLPAWLAVPCRYVAFSGSGRTLGASSSSSSAAGAGSSSQPLGATTASTPPGEWAGADDSKPTTSLQLRLYDGSRLVARFNHTHTIADIRVFLRAARPDMTGPYTLTAGFPAAPLTDEGRTLEAAGLLNAVIIQKR